VFYNWGMRLNRRRTSDSGGRLWFRTRRIQREEERFHSGSSSPFDWFA
jgi:hypothetical protein